MPINSIFIYDELLNTDIRETLRITPINEIIAEAEGKLYNMAQTYIAMRDKDTKRRYNRKIFGSLLTFNETDMSNVLSAIDTFKGCSRSRIGINHEDDMCFRFITTVYPITFDTIHEFKNFQYQYNKGRKCHMYFGNKNNAFIKDKLSRDRHGRIENGFYKQGFISLLERKGYTITT